VIGMAETARDRLERQWHEDQWWCAYFLARRIYRLALEAQPARCEAVILTVQALAVATGLVMPQRPSR
jgi:hypothetical protein